MNDLYVAFMIITTRGTNFFEFDGDIFQKMDVLNLINGCRPVVWFDHTQHRKMYLYDDAMKKAVKLFAEKYGSRDNNTPFRLRKFMNRLGENEPFYMFRMEHSLIHVTQLQIVHAVYQLMAVRLGEQEDELWNKVKDDMATFFNDYEINTLGPVKYLAGEDSKERVCRFCGMSIVDGATFNHKSHAIPEALGNKTLFCNEECDSCNKRLAPIEDSLSAYLEIRRSLCDITGKKGKNSVAGQNFVFDSKTHQLLLDEKARVDDEGDRIRVRLDGRVTFTLQGLYKALAKIIIDLVDNSKLFHFRNTISWINGNLCAKEFPPIKQLYCDTVHKQPILELFIRKDEYNTDVGPYCFANLHVCDLVLQYVVPFVDVDYGKMKSAALIHPYEKKMGTTLAIYNWKSEWLDSGDTTQRTAWTDLEYSKSDLKPTKRKANISRNLKMMPPKWETDTVSFPMFSPLNVVASRLLCCRLSNINKNAKVTREWLHDTSNNMVCNLIVNEKESKVLVDIQIELCNTDNTEHLFDMCVTKEYHIKKLSDVLFKEPNGLLSMQKLFTYYITAQALAHLNSHLKFVHPLFDVSIIDLEMICEHYNCQFGHWKG